MPDAVATFRAELEKSTCRLLWFGVTYGDLRAAAEAGSWPAWSERLAERATHYEELADEASARHPESAGELGDGPRSTTTTPSSSSARAKPSAVSRSAAGRASPRAARR